MKDDVRKVLVVPDFQVPFHAVDAIVPMLKYASEERWDEVVLLGDFMDLDHISTYAKARHIEGRRLLKDYEIGKDLLDQIEAAVQRKNKAVKLIFLEGNHDERAERYADENPQLEGMVEVQNGLELKKRGWKYVQCYTKGDTYNIGKAAFHHGLYHNKAHARTHVENFGTNIFYGHVHDIQSFSKVNFGKNQTLIGQSMGCMCDYEQGYIKKNPTNWQHAFGVFWFRPSGRFNYTVVRIFDGEFVAPNGKVYTKE